MSYFALATTTLASAASSVTFSSIPTSVNGLALRDLVLVADVATANSSIDIFVRANSDATNTYPYALMQGDSGGAASGAGVRTGFHLGFKITGNSKATSHLQIMDFSATDKHKPSLLRYSEAGTFSFTAAGRWPSTNAINTLTAVPATGNWSSGSTFSLYGVA